MQGSFVLANLTSLTGLRFQSLKLMGLNMIPVLGMFISHLQTFRLNLTNQYCPERFQNWRLTGNSRCHKSDGLGLANTTKDICLQGTGILKLPFTTTSTAGI